MSRTVALILANDPGSGFAGPKYLHRVRGSAMIERVLADVATWPVDEVVVVLGPDAEEIVATADLGEATIVIDPEWEEGLAASLRVGIDVLSRGPEADQLVIGLADQPGVDGDIVAALLERGAAHRAVVPKYRYRRGWPVLVSSDLGDLLLRMEGPVDVHDVLESHIRDVEVEEVWFDRLEPDRLRSPEDLPVSPMDG